MMTLLRTIPNNITRPYLTKWDAVIVGGGHNGLVAAAYLAKAGHKVCVFENRGVVGGAAVTEEIVPGFKFSRASYVFSLFRPQIIKELELQRHGLHVYPRDPSSFTPTLDRRSLVLGSDMEANQKEIAKFSIKDAMAFPAYNQMLQKLVDFFVPMLDEAPPDPRIAFGGPSVPFRHRTEALMSMCKLAGRAVKLGRDLGSFIELMTAPADKILNRWFESDILKATLATDAVIGAKLAPSSPGSAYVLFHHVMGECDGVKGMWGHVRGGMGSVSQAIAAAAVEAGAVIRTGSPVESISVGRNPSGNGKAVGGVVLKDGSVVEANTVLSGVSPVTTFLDLLDSDAVDKEYQNHFRTSWNCESTSTKINLALDRLPNFTCLPNSGDGNTPMPHHRGTIHFEENMMQIEDAFTDVRMGEPSRRPVIEMNIPSALDPSIAPPGKHVALLFIQYTPYELKGSSSWSCEETRRAFVDRVFSVIELYAPGFKSSIIEYDMLTPPDLERVFGLPKGNIFHGAMGLDQLFWLRPAAGIARYRTPVTGLYLCGAGAHPGGGVMGAAGRNAAAACLSDRI